MVAFAAVTLWNAATYPPGLGYDASDHIAYAEGILERGNLPDGIGEYYTPPAFYTVAAGATWVGEQVGLGEPRRAVQGMNALLAIATALLLLMLLRELWPGREVLHLVALGVFACGGLVAKSAAMYHPETLDLFLSTLALVLAARLLVRRDFRLGRAVPLGLVLGAAQLVRAFSLWTFAVVLLALGAAALREQDRRRVLATIAGVVAAVALVAGPWYAYQAGRYSNPVFDRPQVAKPIWERQPAAFYVSPGLPAVIAEPYTPSFLNRFVPTLYADTWGDYFGFFGWRVGDLEPTDGQRRDLVAQSVVGLLPTLLAIAGWLGLLVLAVRRLQPAPLLVALLPLAGLAGMLYFAVSYPTPDGDVIKGTYMLTTAPAWAACAGLAADRLAARPRLGLVLAVLLGASALVGLRFGIYGSPLGGIL